MHSEGSSLAGIGYGWEYKQQLNKCNIYPLMMCTCHFLNNKAEQGFNLFYFILFLHFHKIRICQDAIFYKLKYPSILYLQRKQMHP